jgi:hypothetical protein
LATRIPETVVVQGIIGSLQPFQPENEPFSSYMERVSCSSQPTMWLRQRVFVLLSVMCHRRQDLHSLEESGSANGPQGYDSSRD